MNRKNESQRLQSLFDDLERIAADPAGNTTEIRQELEALRARLCELEAEIKNVNTARVDENVDGKPEEKVVVEADGSLEIQKRASQPLVYEKDFIAYAFSNDQVTVLKETKPIFSGENFVVSPLTASGQVIGEVQIAPPADHQLTEDDLSLANSIAQQASVQIQNLRLLADAERSRYEAESATRRFIHESWDSYLDAINRSERIGYTYDQSGVSPYSDVLQAHDGVQASVKVLDEEVGKLYVSPNPAHPLTEEEQDLINSVADQVAQQVENIRLLADASRARADAEEAIRRLAHDNWQKFAEDKDESDLAFVYDTFQVTPLKDKKHPQDFVLSQPLVVGGETIGQLAIAGLQNLPDGATNLAASVAAQASIHLETLRLAEELQKRARELEELDRLKSAFLANMSHELRTPLNSILGFTDVMLEGLDGPLTDYMNNDLRLIQKNGQHLLHLINDVLDMAKIESGRMNLHPENFLLHDLLDEVTSITSTLASEKNTALFIEEDSDREVSIYADNTRIRQVMINLVNNAIKFTANGKISLRAAMMDGARVLVSVKDTGLGIPPHMLESIFEEFSQVDTSTTRKAGGTGLGLPISRRLVEMHGGRLWAESTGVEGEGSTFFVELPLEARIAEVIEKQEK